MPVPASISDLSTTPALNSPAGSESPALVDDYLRTHAAFIKQVNDATALKAADADVVKLTGNQTIAGTKTFSSTIVGSVSGNAGTVTNGLYTTDLGVTVQAYDANTAKTNADQSWTGSPRATPVTDNDGSFDMNAGLDFLCTPTAGFTLTFTNIAQGQRGCIYLVNGSNYTIAAAATTKVTPTLLASISATGEYWLSYWSPDGTNVLVAHAGDFT